MFFEKYLVHFFWRKQQHYLWFCPIFFPNLFFQHVFLLFSVSSIPGRRYGPTKPKTWSSWGTGGWPGFCWGIHGGVQLSVRGFSQAISEFKKKTPINNLRIFLVSSFWGCMLMGYKTHHTFFVGTMKVVQKKHVKNSIPTPLERWWYIHRDSWIDPYKTSMTQGMFRIKTNSPGECQPVSQHLFGQVCFAKTKISKSWEIQTSGSQPQHYKNFDLIWLSTEFE